MFHLFAGINFYPCGGADDYLFSLPSAFDFMEKIRKAHFKGYLIKCPGKDEVEKENHFDWWHIVSDEDGEIKVVLDHTAWEETKLE